MFLNNDIGNIQHFLRYTQKTTLIIQEFRLHIYMEVYEKSIRYLQLKTKNKLIFLFPLYKRILLITLFLSCIFIQKKRNLDPHYYTLLNKSSIFVQYHLHNNQNNSTL